jgi:hypothetical protein
MATDVGILQYHTVSTLSLGPQLGEDIGKDDHTGFPEDPSTSNQPDRLHEQARTGDVYPNRIQCHRKEVIDQHQGLSDYAAKQTDWSVDAVSTKFEVLEASHLQSLELIVVGCEKRVQRLCEDVDDGGQTFSSPVEGTHLFADELGVVEQWDLLRA